jgi:hypothetical protein
MVRARTLRLIHVVITSSWWSAGRSSHASRLPISTKLLYKIFQSITFRLAYSYALEHRIEAQDWRRFAFSAAGRVAFAAFLQIGASERQTGISTSCESIHSTT